MMCFRTAVVKVVNRAPGDRPAVSMRLTRLKIRAHHPGRGPCNSLGGGGYRGDQKSSKPMGPTMD